MSKDKGSYLGRNLKQALNFADENLVRNDLTDFVPIPTGFPALDRHINRGLRKTELVLLGGAQGVGKTIVSLQIARNIAANTDYYVYYVSYEHSEVHLMHRLLCLESVSCPDGVKNGIRLSDLYQLISDRQVVDEVKNYRKEDILLEIFNRDERVAQALERMRQYEEKLIIRRASFRDTSIRKIQDAVHKLANTVDHRLVLFIDYLQKIPVDKAIDPFSNEDEKISIIVQGLKEIAMGADIPVWAISSATREGLQSRRLHLYHLHGGSMLDYEADIALIMHNKYSLLADKSPEINPTVGRARESVVFTIEKNRAGKAFQDIEFKIDTSHFSLDSEGKDAIGTFVS
jgi:replicative DNA helicase